MKKEKVVESTESVKEPALKIAKGRNAGSLTLSVDSTTFSFFLFFILFVCLYPTILHFSKYQFHFLSK